MAKFIAPLVPVFAETETAAGRRFLILECGHWQYPTGQGVPLRRRCLNCLTATLKVERATKQEQT